MRRLIPFLALAACLAGPSALAGDVYKCTVTGTGAASSASTCTDEETGDAYSVLGDAFYLVKCDGDARIRFSRLAGKSAVTIGVDVVAKQLYPAGRYVGPYYISVAAAVGVKCYVFTGDPS